MKPSSSSLAPFFASLAACAAIVRETAFIPQGWQKVGTAASRDQPYRLSFALKQNRMHHLDSVVNSGAYLSRDAARSMKGADPDAVAIILKWLEEAGLVNVTSLIDEWVHVDTTVGATQQLLNTTMFPFALNGGPSVWRSTRYTLPEDVNNKVDFVLPLNHFMNPGRRSRPMQATTALPSEIKHAQLLAVGSGAAACQSEVTPQCISSLYNMTQVGDDMSNVTFGVAGFLEEDADSDDMQTFLKQFAPNIKSTSFDVELVNNGTNPQDNPGLEANLDVQYAKSLGPNGRVIFYSVGGRGVMLDDDGNPVTVDNSNEPYLQFLDYLLDKPDGELPHVLSISYGDDELSVPQEYAINVCNTFGLLAARGVSIIVSSGDGGSAGSQSSHCVTHDNPKREVTMGVFPATCPYVTSVGATENTQEPPSGATFSGGGFSQIFARPEWQDGDGLVDDYITGLNGHLDGKFNGSMRAYPDVAAVGTSFAIIVNGNKTHVDGTSASAPTFAAMIARIIDYRLQLGKKPLGLLNRYLYSDQVRSILQDITSGTSASCIWGDSAPGGWPALKGWDAMTGLGVPKDFDALMQALVAVD